MKQNQKESRKLQCLQGTLYHHFHSQSIKLRKVRLTKISVKINDLIISAER